MRPAPALAAAVLLTAALGSVHAFSVFAAPLEAALDAGRDAVSLAYSIALLCITAAVLVGPRVWRLGPPEAVAAASLAVAAAGSFLAAQPSTTALYLGYGVLFGLANGSGYGFALVVASHALPRNRGLGMGAATAAYAAGAMAASWLFRESNAAFGHDSTLRFAGAAFVALAVVAAVLLRRSGLVVAWPERGAGALAAGGTTIRRTALLWVGFGAGAMAGLMALGHAAEAIRARGGGEAIVTAGVTVVAGANALGGFAAGWLADRGRLRRLLAGLPLLAVAALLALAAGPGPAATVALLALVQVSYGGIIVLYPVAATRMAGPAWGPVLYGRVFTGWGAAGFVGPWLAGRLFEETGGYASAYVIAAGVACLSTAAVLALGRRLDGGGGSPGRP